MKRRRKGEGTIRQRANGSWEARIGGHSYYGRTQRDAIERMMNARSESFASNLPRGEDPPIGSLLAAWLLHIKTRVRPNTFNSYESVCKKHLTPALGKIRARQLTPANVAGLLDTLSKTFSSGTVRSIRTVLKMCLAWAANLELVRRNVAAIVKPPRKAAPLIEPLSESELTALLSTVEGHEDSCAIRLLATCGLRLGELCGLKWDDVNLDGATLSIKRTLQAKVGVMEPKTEKSKRTLNLPAKMVASLRSHRAKQLECRLALGEKWKDEGWVFTSVTGHEMDRWAFRKRFRKHIKAAGITRRVRLHDLRHTAATLLLRNGAQLPDVSALLGHASTQTTLIYVHSLNDGPKLVAAIMDRLTGG